jgi:hypothetical protein
MAAAGPRSTPAIPAADLASLWTGRLLSKCVTPIRCPGERLRAGPAPASGRFAGRIPATEGHPGSADCTGACQNSGMTILKNAA